MAKIFEFSGATGVGKSTVYNKMSSLWTEEYNWFPAHKLYPRTNNNHHPIKKVICSFKKYKIDEREMRKAASRFILNNPDFVNDCWYNVIEENKLSFNNSDQRFEKAFHLFKMFQKIQICRESTLNKILILEEGIINSISNLLPKYNNQIAIENKFSNLFINMPFPDGLIFFEIDPYELVKRVNNRNRFIPFLEGLNEDRLLKTLELIQLSRKTAAKIYENLQYPVLYIDSSNTVAQNVEQIIVFLEKHK